VQPPRSSRLFHFLLEYLKHAHSIVFPIGVAAHRESCLRRFRQILQLLEELAGSGNKCPVSYNYFFEVPITLEPQKRGLEGFLRIGPGRIEIIRRIVVAVVIVLGLELIQDENAAQALQTGSGIGAQRITAAQKKDVIGYLKSAIESACNDEISALGLEGKTSAALSLTWNEKLLQGHFLAYQLKAKELMESAKNGPDYAKNLERVRAALKDLNEQARRDEEEYQKKLASKQESERERIVIPQGGRLGWFNLDLKGGKEFEVPLYPKSDSSNQERQSPFILTIPLEGIAGGKASEPAQALPPFAFDPADYVASVNVQLTLPSGAQGLQEDVAKKIIVETMSQIVPASTASNAKIGLRQAKAPQVPQKEKEPLPPLPSLEEAGKRFLLELLEPKSPFLGNIVLAVPVTLAILISALLVLGMWRSSNRLIDKFYAHVKSQADAVAAKEAAAAELSSSELSDLSDLSTDAGVVTERFDRTQTANALTQQLQAIKESFLRVIQSDLEATAESIANQSLSPQGLESIAQISSFVGYEVMRPAFALFDYGLRSRLEVIFLERRNVPPSLLEGAEAAQLILVQTNTRISDLGERFASPAARKLRQLLLKMGDSELQKLLADKSDRMAASLLVTLLTADRCVKVLRGLDSQVAATILKQCENISENSSTLIEQTLSSLAQVSQSKSGQLNQRKKILRLLSKDLHRSDEAKVLALLNGADWEVRFDLVKNSYLFSDIVFLPGELIRKLIESFKGFERSSLVFGLSPDIRNKALAAFPDGSKAKEVLMMDLESIDRSEKKKSEAQRVGQIVLDRFHRIVRERVTADPQLLKRCLTEMCSANNWELPSQLGADEQDSSQVAA